MTKEDLEAELERTKAELAALKAQGTRAGSVSFKVSEKGAVSVYGLGRFPVNAVPGTMAEAAREGRRAQAVH